MSLPLLQLRSVGATSLVLCIVGHLHADSMHTTSRVFRIAGLYLWFSGAFVKHQRRAFWFMWRLHGGSLAAVRP